jgi:hypothetical protein
VLGVAFYWRQNVLILAPVIALAHASDEWRLLKERAASDQPIRVSRSYGVMGLRAALVVILPYLCAQPWTAYSDPAFVRDMGIRQGIIRQALLPPNDPYIAPHARQYRTAIVAALRTGNFLSGIEWHELMKLSETAFARPFPESPSRFLLSKALTYPHRYSSGICRTLLLFAGFKPVESDNRIYRDQVLHPTFTGSKISDGPEPLRTRIHEQFSQDTTDSLAAMFLRHAIPVYDVLLILASFVTVGGFAAGVVLRERRLILLCGIPLIYVMNYAVLLMAIDRFAVPIYPLVLSNLLVAPVLIFSRLRQAKSA